MWYSMGLLRHPTVALFCYGNYGFILLWNLHMRWHVFAMMFSSGILGLKVFFWKILNIFLLVKSRLFLAAMHRESTSYFQFFLWRDHLLHLRCSMIEHVSGQAWSSVTMANSSSYQLMEGSFDWLMPLKELSCIHLGWACCLCYCLKLGVWNTPDDTHFCFAP